VEAGNTRGGKEFEMAFTQAGKLFLVCFDLDA
jgi:hypothetical protein